MQIKIIYANNALRNYNYIISCPQSKEAVIIDPLISNEIIEYINQKKLSVKYIINTHEHWDHVGGNQALKKVFKAPVCCHPNGLMSIPKAERGLSANDQLTLGDHISIKILDTPGHTLAHLCLLATDNQKTGLFSGDTLFNAGCGNCHNGGNVEKLYHTFSEQLINLPDNTQIYPGHDYIMNNLEFTLSREPSNIKAKTLLEELRKNHDPNTPFTSTIKLEKEINAFFRLTSSEIKSTLNLEQHETDEAVFSKLRALRDKW